MNPEITRIIEQYLNNELSASDKAAFEKRLAENETLRKEVEFQKTIHEGAKRSAQRSIVKKTAKSYHFKKNIITTSVAVLVAAAIAVGTYVAVKTSREKQEGISTEILNSLLDKLDEVVPMENVPVEYFELTKKDTVVLSQNGVLLSVPEGAFLLNGKPYSGTKVVQWQEAMDAATIVKGGLSTMSGDRLLETQGMFGIQAFTPEGKKLQVNTKVGVYVQVPVDELKQGMQLFEGKPNAKGVIDWQNPKPLEKKPVMASMKDLDFYPPGYEKELNNLKWKTGKKSRDSLYLSLEEKLLAVIGQESYPIEEFTTVELQGDTISKPISTSKWELEGTTYLTAENYSLGVSLEDGRVENQVRVIIKGQVLSDYPQPSDFSLTSLHPTVTLQRTSILVDKGIGWKKVRLTANANLPDVNKCIVKAIFIFQAGNESKREEISLVFKRKKDSQKPAAKDNHIPPPSVLAFWNTKFDNTILSTRDFEKRMAAVHSTCNKEVLEQYTKNIRKPLYEIDEAVAKMGYPQFAEFAKERVGAVELNDPHMKNLEAFYEKAIAQLKEKARSDKYFVKNLEAKYDAKMRESRTNESGRRVVREAQNYTEEKELNYEDCLRQLGKKRPVVGFTITGGVSGNTSVYNLDRFVAEMTANRTSGSFYDKETGKTAKIQYNAFTASVEKVEQYGKLFLYLFPKELNSFQRIDQKINGKFDYPLNNIIQYDLAVVGINESGYHIYTQKGLNSGNLGELKLEKVSEKEFNKMIEKLNSGRNTAPMKIKEELNWLADEQKDYKVQRLRQEMEAFRRKMKWIVFPCAYPTSADDESGDGDGIPDLGPVPQQ